MKMGFDGNAQIVSFLFHKKKKKKKNDRLPPFKN